MPLLDFKKLKEELIEKHGDSISDVDVMSSALYPKVFDEYAEFRSTYGPVDKLDTRNFFIGPDIANEVSVSDAKIQVTHTTKIILLTSLSLFHRFTAGALFEVYCDAEYI